MISDICLCEGIPDLRLNFQFRCWRWQCSCFSFHVQGVHKLFSKLKLLGLKNTQFSWQNICISYLTTARCNFSEIAYKKLHIKRKRRRALKSFQLAKGVCYFTLRLGFSLGKTFSFSLNCLSSVCLMIRNFADLKFMAILCQTQLGITCFLALDMLFETSP